VEVLIRKLNFGNSKMANLLIKKLDNMMIGLEMWLGAIILGRVAKL
jgi:hypothetical protein